jgi:hypothetical protein
MSFLHPPHKEDRYGETGGRVDLCGGYGCGVVLKITP